MHTPEQIADVLDALTNSEEHATDAAVPEIAYRARAVIEDLRDRLKAAGEIVETLILGER